jgi:hypothetical protein
MTGPGGACGGFYLPEHMTRRQHAVGRATSRSDVAGPTSGVVEVMV